MDSSKQRKFEMGKTKYDKRQKEYKDTVSIKISKNNFKTITQIETELSNCNSKICEFNDFKIYLNKKNKTNNLLFEHYEKDIYRKLKWYRYINKQRSEQKFINEFKKLYGNPNKVSICIGDYEQTKQMKYKEPTKGKGFREMFRRNDYNVYLVDEFRTSKLCHNCHHITEKFLKRSHFKNKDKTMIVHGLLRCTNVKCLEVQGKYRYWNRDVNGALNILKLATNIVNGKQIPKKFRRDYKLGT